MPTTPSSPARLAVRTVFQVLFFACLAGCSGSGCPGCDSSSPSSPPPTPSLSVGPVKCNSATVTVANADSGASYFGTATGIPPGGGGLSLSFGSGSTMTFSDLQPNTTYSVNAYGQNSAGPSGTGTTTFTTPSCSSSGSSSSSASVRTLTVVVTDQMKPPSSNKVAGAKVTVTNPLVPGATLTGTTNAQGAATFTIAVPPGAPPGSGSVSVAAEKVGFKKGTATAAGTSSTQVATVTVPLVRIPGRILPGQ